jgi:hypothetical protein
MELLRLMRMTYTRSLRKAYGKLTDDELAKILDKFIATKPHISALVRKVSWAEARRVVSEASKKYHDMNKMIKGATSTADLARNKATTLIDETIAELRAKGTNEEKIKELVAGLQAEGMAVTTIVPEVANAKIDLELQKQTLPGETKTEPAVQPAEVRKPIQFGAKK